MASPEDAAGEAPPGGLGPARGAEPDRVRRMRHAFLEALARHPERAREELYGFAGRPVRLRVLGEDLAARAHRAFAHLRLAPGAAEPVLSIDLWDEGEAAGPGLPDDADADLDRRWVACDGALTASSDGRYVSFRYRDSLLVLDRRGRQLLGCRRRGVPLSGGEYSKPLLLMLSVWYPDAGVQLLHTGLVAHDGAGVLVPGESGTGKSTTSLASFDQGLEFLGDDFVGLERGPDGGFVGHSLFSTACLTPDGFARFPALRPHAVVDPHAEDEKPILFLAEIHPGRIRASVPIRAVVLLRVRSPRTEILPARPAEALRQIAASTLHTVVPRPGRQALETIGALVESVPAYWLRLGPDLRDVRPSLESVVSRARGAHAS